MSTCNISGIGTIESTTERYIVTISFDAANNNSYTMNCRFIASEPITNYTQLLDYCSRSQEVYNEKGILVTGYYYRAWNDTKILLWLRYAEVEEMDTERRILEMIFMSNGVNYNALEVYGISGDDESYTPAIFNCEKL